MKLKFPSFSGRWWLLAGGVGGLAWPWAGSVRAEWPQWRGPERTGVVKGPVWPSDFAKLEPAWEVPLGPSYSGPVITGKFVFTTESVDKRLERVHAVDRATGK